MEIIKKPRGRPRKILEENLEEKKPRKILEEDLEKKPRGRPRKVLEEDLEKKPRGRPRKILEEDLEKKPRGRPRKILEKDLEEKPKKVIENKFESEKNVSSKNYEISNRILNYKNIKKMIKDDDKLKINGNEIYLGNIKIIKKIGSESKNGLILLGEINNFKVALKITKYNKNELDTFKILTNAVINKKINNFPIMYDYKIYESMDEYEKFPKIFHKFIKNPYIIYINELANGDLKEFLIENYNNDELIINALYQSLMSLIEFYKITGKFHNDSHSGNFLYYKIPIINKYINGTKIKNMGYLFVIWDFEKSTEFKKNKYRVNTDIEKLLLEFFNKDDKIKGFMSAMKPYGTKVKNIVMDLYNKLILNNKASFYELGYSPEKLEELISIILEKII